MQNGQIIRRHIETEYTAPVRDPLWSHIYLSPAMMRLVDTNEFQQLSRIKQLGPTYLVYPGATHTRLNHSLGVFHIAKRVITDYVRRLDPAEAAGPLSALTAREREVLQLAADGSTVRQIAARLHLSPKTVEHHRAAAMNKLDLHNQTDLVKYAIRIGLTEPWSTT